MSSPVNIDSLIFASNPSDLCEVMKAYLQAIAVLRGDLDYRVDESDGDRPHDDFLHDLARYFPVLYAEASNTGNAYTATVPFGAVLGTTTTFTELTELKGRLIILKISADNTGPSTLSINNLTATTISKGAAVALVGGEMPANKLAVVVYNGSTFHLLNPEIPTAGESVLETGEVDFPAKGDVGQIARPSPTSTLIRVVARCTSDDGDYSEDEEVDAIQFEEEIGSGSRINAFTIYQTESAWKIRRAASQGGGRTELRGTTETNFSVVDDAKWKLRALYL